MNSCAPTRTQVDNLNNSLGWSSESLEGISARSLADLYLSERVLENEIRRVFLAEWTLLGSSDSLQHIGAFECHEVLGIPIVLIRQKDGQIKGFFNQCTHRALPILKGKGVRKNVMTCPYHQWSFKISGELSTVPQISEFDHLEKGALGLIEFKTATWRGLVFGDLLGLAGPFAEIENDLTMQIGGEFEPDYSQRFESHYEISCNWKLLIENHLDVYHLWYLHAKTLNAFDHHRFQWQQSGNNWWSYEPLKSTDGVIKSSRGSTEKRDGIGAHLIYPNIMIVTTPNYVATYDALPIDPGSTKLSLRIRADETIDTDSVLKEIRAFLSEDIQVCERLQHSVHSPMYAIGALASRYEQPILNFHRNLRASLGV